MDLFISHSHLDSESEHICGLLERRGLICWIAPRDIPAGSIWDEAIPAAITSCKALLVILTSHANESKDVANEVKLAVSANRKMFVLRAQDVEPAGALAYHVGRLQRVDAFSPPLDEKVYQLARDILGALVTPHWTEASDKIPPEARRYVKEATEFLSRNYFVEAGQRYIRAATEAEKYPGAERGAIQYRANAGLYASWGLYAKTNVSGMFGARDLDRAAQLAERARELWRRASNDFGEQAAEGWRLYLVGVQQGLASRYEEATQQFEKAREIFLRLEQTVPDVRDTTQPLISLTEQQLILADTMAMWSDENAETRLGEINRRLNELGRRFPAERPVYEGIIKLARGQSRLKEGSDRLVSWNYTEADRLLSEAEMAFTEASQSFDNAQQSPESLTQPAQYLRLVDGWSAVTRAERHHAHALESIFERLDLGGAKVDLAQGVESYRAAQSAIESAFFGSQAVKAVQRSAQRLSERMFVVASAGHLPARSAT